jgi:hypothetical protein
MYTEHDQQVYDEQEEVVSISKEELMGLLASSEDDGDAGGEGVFDPGDDTITLHK